MSESVFSCRDLTYSYPGAHSASLDSVSLQVGQGEFVVLAGRSGSGKSSLLRAACGLVPHFHGGAVSGEVEVAGHSTRDHGPAELAREVGFVAQEPEVQVVSTTVRAELELPLELRGRGSADRARSVEEVALALGIEPLLDRTTDSLSGGELQRVAIGAALVTRPPLLLLDEPTSQLDPVAGDELIGLLRRLNEEWGVAIVLGEHRLERCLSAADRVLALESGRLIFDGTPDEFGAWACEFAPWLSTPGARLFELAGRPERPVSVKAARLALGSERPEHSESGSHPTPEPGSHAGLVLRATRLTVTREAGSRGGQGPAIDGLDIEIRAGERVALMGPNGAGKSTALRAIAGLDELDEGALDVPRELALLTQRPDDYFLRERVGDELPGDAGSVALEAAGLEVDPDRDPRDLSGGERQRLALAIAFAGRGAGGSPPGLACLDEPTRGLDRRRKAGLVEWLRGLADAGSGLLVATHDVEFAALFAERVILLARGRVLADGPAREVLSGGWYFATEVARITDGAAITAEEGAALLAAGRRPKLPGGAA